MVPAVLTVPEVAATLRIGESSVRRLIAAGTIQRIPHVGSRVLVASAELNRVFGVEVAA